MGGTFPEPHFIQSNDIRMAVYEQGSGPAVVFLHGFPELALSWRFQLPALAIAGFRAIAPDQRGYGRTEVPPEIADYHIQTLIADVHGLLDALQLDSATFVGHDMGALLCWQMSLLTPERMDSQVILNIPFFPRLPVDPITVFREALGDDFYIVNFQDSNEADRAFAADPRHFFDVIMRRNQITREVFDTLPQERKVFSFIAAVQREKSAGQPLLTDEERDYYADAYTGSGFTGPINWYRNWSRNWADTEGVEQVVRVPTLFIGAHDDVIVSPAQIDAMKPHVTDLDIRMLRPCGHWTQQERPDDVNRLIIDWLGRRHL